MTNHQVFVVTVVTEEETITPGQVGDAVIYGIDGPQVERVSVIGAHRSGESLKEYQARREHELRLEKGE
jgi:t-SNARE complex subunit (syntaxin)